MKAKKEEAERKKKEELEKKAKEEAEKKRKIQEEKDRKAAAANAPKVTAPGIKKVGAGGKDEDDSDDPIARSLKERIAAGGITEVVAKKAVDAARRGSTIVKPAEEQKGANDRP